MDVITTPKYSEGDLAGKDVVVDRHIRGTLLKLGFDLKVGEEVKIVVIKKAS